VLGAEEDGNKVDVTRFFRSNSLSIVMFGLAAAFMLGLTLAGSWAVRLRNRGSSESKPVHAAHATTGS